MLRALTRIISPSLHIKVIPSSCCLQETLTAFPPPWLLLLLMSSDTSEAHSFEEMEKEQGHTMMQSFSLSGMTTYQESLLLQVKFSLIFRNSKTYPNLMQLLETKGEYLLWNLQFWKCYPLSNSTPDCLNKTLISFLLHLFAVTYFTLTSCLYLP